MFADLDAIVSILGTTKTTFWPLLESMGRASTQVIRAYGNDNRILAPRDEGGGVLRFDEMNPFRHHSGLFSYDLSASSNHNLISADANEYSFPSNEDFSVGLWIYPRDITTVTLMAKYDINDAREWRMELDGSSKLSLEVLDETEATNGTRIGASDTVVSAEAWQFVVVTTDNNDSDASMSFYINGAADGSGNAETGTYNDSPGTGSAFTIGASLNTYPALANVFDGRVALPFVCGKELSAAEVAQIYDIGKRLLGMA